MGKAVTITINNTCNYHALAIAISKDNTNKNND
jgi:hypothetical protein